MGNIYFLGSFRHCNVHTYVCRVQLVKGTKTGQGLRINQVKYQIIKSITDENSQCYSVYGKKVIDFFFILSYILLFVLCFL